MGTGLWKAVAATATTALVIGASMMIAHLEPYGLTVVVGGFALLLLGFLYALRERQEWKRPPRVPRGLRVSHFPLGYDPKRFPGHPHYQDVDIFFPSGCDSPILRVFCSSSIIEIDGEFLPPRERAENELTFSWVNRSIDAVTVIPFPFASLEPSSSLFLRIFSDSKIRVRKVKILKPRVDPQSAKSDS